MLQRCSASVVMLASWLLVASTAASFDRALWQGPTVRERSDGTTEISVPTAPAGVILTRALDPEKRYQLVVQGAGGPFTLRLQIDDKPYEYLAAPTGTSRRVVTGASQLELLFYADQPATYVLKNAAIEECAVCYTEEDVHSRILREAPEVASLRGLDKAVALLRWAANTADYTPNTELIPGDFESWPLERMIYEFFDLDRGGVSCGGFSVFFNKVLRLFGIESFTINYGVPNTLATHVSVIVYDNGAYYMLDPTFAVVFQRDGRMVPIDEALKLVMAGSADVIRVRELGLERRDFIGFSKKRHPEIDAICQIRTVTVRRMPKCNIGSNSYLDAFRQRHASTWQAAGVPLDSFGLLRLMKAGVFSVGPGMESLRRQQFVEMLKSHGVGFHKAD